jgi:phytanoyl-CoA hydroxylase
LSDLIKKFNQDGFIEIENFFKKKEIQKLKKKYKKIFFGNYSTGVVPDKIKWVNGRDPNNSPRSLCNVWKSDLDIAKIVLSKSLGKLVSSLTNWKSVKLNQDSLIWVTPGSGTVAFHQDNPYQDWHIPGKVVTVWIPLSNTVRNGGTLEYLVGSHKENVSDRLNKFYSNKDYRKINKKLLNNPSKFKRHFVCLKSGSLAIHHGNMWHGSGYNMTSSDRISLSIHFMPGNSIFHKKIKSPYFNHYKLINSSKMYETFFPTTWSKNRKNFFLTDYLKKAKL